MQREQTSHGKNGGENATHEYKLGALILTRMGEVCIPGASSPSLGSTPSGDWQTPAWHRQVWTFSEPKWHLFLFWSAAQTGQPVPEPPRVARLLVGYAIWAHVSPTGFLVPPAAFSDIHTVPALK